MISKSILFTTLVCVVLALDLKFEEGGSIYTEKILIEDKENTVEYDVPQHGKVDASKHLVDYDSDYKVMKNLQRQECYVMDLTKNEPKPIQVKLALMKMNGTFPNNYFVETNNIFPLYKMDVSQLSQSILTFCGDYPITKSIPVKNAKEAEQVAVKMFRKKQRQRRQAVTYPEYITCKPPSYKECMNDPNKFIFKCQIKVSLTCIYKATCKPVSTGGWNCQGNHLMQSGVICCDVVCK